MDFRKALPYSHEIAFNNQFGLGYLDIWMEKSISAGTTVLFFIKISSALTPRKLSNLFPLLTKKDKNFSRKIRSYAINQIDIENQILKTLSTCSHCKIFWCNLITKVSFINTEENVKFILIFNIICCLAYYHTSAVYLQFNMYHKIHSVGHTKYAEIL